MPAMAPPSHDWGHTSGTMPLPAEAMHAEPGTSPPIWAVIFAGGIGSRFWPLATPTTPKPVLPLVDGRPLVADSVGRLDPLIPAGRVSILSEKGRWSCRNFDFRSQ